EAWGAGAAALAPRFTMSLAAACAPSRSTLARVRVRGAFRAICFVARLAKGVNHLLRLASRISSRKVGVAPT
ncbi:MAG: hypothetical protein ACREUI_06590, partial [Burkholderiales bacterium]